MPQYILLELIDKEITLFFDNGDDITGTLRQIPINTGVGQLAGSDRDYLLDDPVPNISRYGVGQLAGSDRDYLILSANDGKRAVVYLDTVTMILEGPVHW